MYTDATIGNIEKTREPRASSGELIERAISDEAVEARKHSKAYLDLQDRRQGDRQPVSGGRDGRLPASMRTVISPRHRSASGGTQRLCFSH
jgi:hypothetical protein